MENLTAEQLKIELSSFEYLALKEYILKLLSQEPKNATIQFKTEKDTNMIFSCLLVITNTEEDYSTAYIFQADAAEQIYDQYRSYSFSYQEAINLAKLLNL